MYQIPISSRFLSDFVESCAFSRAHLYANPQFKGTRMYYFTKMRLYHDYHKVPFVVRGN